MHGVSWFNRPEVDFAMITAATGLPCFIYLSVLHACVSSVCVCVLVYVEMCTRVYIASVHNLQFSLTAIVASNSCYAQKFES